MPDSTADDHLARLVERAPLAMAVERDAARLAGRREDAVAVWDQLIGGAEWPTLVADDRGRYLAASRTACKLTGYNCDELRRRFVWDLTSGATREQFEPLWRAFLSQGRQRGRYSLQRHGTEVVEVAYVAQADVVPGFHVSVLQPLDAASD